MKTWHWLALGGLAAAYFFVSRNRAATAAADPVGVLLGLPDPSGLPIGTRSADGRYVVTQSRMLGSRPQWTQAYLGGEVPGMIT